MELVLHLVSSIRLQKTISAWELGGGEVQDTVSEGGGGGMLMGMT